MLHELVQFSDQIGPLNVFRYISFRAVGATVTALLIVFVFGPMMIDIGERRSGDEDERLRHGIRPPGPTPVQRSFKVVSAASDSTTEMIQKRTTTVASCQPFCSKW